MIRQIVNPSPAFQSTPSITGTAALGNTLAVIIPNLFSPTYQWYRSGVSIGGATSSSYILTEDDRGKEIKCLVSLIDSNSRTAKSWTAGLPFYNDLYISEADGVYANDGHTSGTATTAAKLLTLTLTTYTRLYFKSGEQYEVGDFSIPANSLLTNYGSGADPVIIGSVDISNETWTDEGSNIWSTTIDEPTWVFVDDVKAKLTTSIWYAVASLPTGSTIRVTGATKTAIEALSSIVGAKLRMYQFGWILSDVMTVTDYNSGTGDLTVDVPHGAGQSLWFYLYDQQQFLDTVGEWNYDSGKLYYKSTVNPSTLDIRATYYNYGLVIGGNSVTVENFTLKHFYKAGIFNIIGLYLVADSFAVSDVHNAGIFSNLPCTLSDFTIDRCGNMGVNAWDAQITNYSIDSIGVDLNWPMPDVATFGGKYMGNGIMIQKAFRWSYLVTYLKHSPCYYLGKWWVSLQASNLNNTPAEGAYWTSPGDYDPALIPTNGISYGEISNTAYCSINSPSCFELEIYKNKLHDFLKRTRDGGAIYLISSLPTRTQRLWTSYGHIHHNIIYNPTKQTEQSLITAATCNGIYLDNYALYFTVEYNTLIKTNGYKFDYGIFHYVPTKSNTIRYNNIVGAEHGAEIWEHQSYSGFPNEVSLQAYYPLDISNVYEQNVIACKAAADRCVHTRSVDNILAYNPFITGGNSNNNYYIQPFGLDINSHQYSTTVDYTMAEWRTKNGLDAASSERTNFLTYTTEANADIQVRCAYNATDVAVIVDLTGFFDKTGVALGNVTIQPYESIVYTNG